MSISFFATAVWGLAVFGSFIGWGGEIESWLFRTRESDLGLRAAWGMSFAIFVLGTAALVSLASRPAIFLFVALGVLTAIYRAFRAQHAAPFADLSKDSERRTVVVFYGLSIAVALLLYLGSIADRNFNVNDDLVAYFAFAKQIVQQGTLFDPFSTRRVMSLGGQSFLHAMVLAGSPYFRLHILDEGICMLVVTALVIGSRRRGQSPWIPLLGLFLLLTLPNARINTYPAMSGIVTFYGLYRTIEWVHGTRRQRLASAALISLVAIAACTLRSNYIAVAIPMVALSYAQFVLSDRNEISGRIREAGYAAAMGLLFLLPWMILSYQSSGTPLFPLIRGNFNSALTMLRHSGDWHHQLADLAGTVARNWYLPMFPLFALAAAFFTERSARKPLRSLLVATLFGWLLLINTMTSDIPSLLRYVYGFACALALATITACGLPEETAGKRRMLVRVANGIAIVATLIQLLRVTGPAFQGFPAIASEVAIEAPSPLERPEQSVTGRHYSALQSRVPKGETLLVMVDFPFLFDYSRNPIYNLDTAAAVSPRPGMPFFQGPEPVARYFRQTGMKYLAFVRPDKAVELFRRDVWERHLRETQPVWRGHAPLYLDVFDNVEKIGASYKVLYDDGVVILVDLTQRRAGASRQ